jgi:hypothetical protein
MADRWYQAYEALQNKLDLAIGELRWLGVRTLNGVKGSLD